jgi:hydroxyethylthiazole kinase-like uncharacterized protein yjeF
MGRAEGAVLSPALLRDWPLPRAEDGSDKHDRGTALVIGGSVSTPGAVLLAGLAALRVGAGRLQIATVPETAVALGVAVPEAKVVGLPPGELGGVDLEGVSAVLVGPGLLDPDETGRLLDELLPRMEGRPCALDAVALHALEDRSVRGAVLTPNPTELEALDGESSEDLGSQAARVAASRGAVVATLGWVAADDGRRWLNDTGSVGLATSGSGDVLAGAVVGLLARGADPCQAACWATYLHGSAGDRLAATRGRTGFLARELLDALPHELMALVASG